jgi:hypothetical protein
MALQLRQSAYEYAQKLIRNRQLVLDQRGIGATTGWREARRIGLLRNMVAPRSVNGISARTASRQRIASAATSSRTATSRTLIVCGAVREVTRQPRQIFRHRAGHGTPA